MIKNLVYDLIEAYSCSVGRIISVNKKFLSIS